MRSNPELSSKDNISLALNVWWCSSTGAQDKPKCKNVPNILWPKKYFGKSCCIFSIETVNTELIGKPVLSQLVPPSANAPRSKWHPLTMCLHKCQNPLQHEGRRCTRRKGCQSCGIFNLPKDCTELFDRVWPLACTRDLLVAQ